MTGQGQGQGKTLLVPGDSLADGQIAPGYVFTLGQGYNDFLFDKMQKEYSFDTKVDLACPGEMTATFMDKNPDGADTCFSSKAISLCYSNLCDLTEFLNPLNSDSQLQ